MLGLSGGGDYLFDIELFAGSFGIEFPLLRNAEFVQRDYLQPGNGTPYPLDYIIDRQGRVAYFATDYDPDAMVAVIDKVLGLTPSAHVYPEALEFGAVPPGGNLSMLLSIQNQGAGQLVIESIFTAGTEFNSNLGALRVPPGAARNLNITFNPMGEGAYVDTLNLSSNDPVTPVLRLPLSGRGGTEVAAEPPADAKVVLSILPNPVAGTATIRFSLPEAGEVNLAIHDIRGRRVRQIMRSEELSAGTHLRIWEGRNDAGHRLASGIYFIRLEGMNGIRMRKVTLLR